MDEKFNEQMGIQKNFDTAAGLTAASIDELRYEVRFHFEALELKQRADSLKRTLWLSTLVLGCCAYLVLMKFAD